MFLSHRPGGQESHLVLPGERQHVSSTVASFLVLQGMPCALAFPTFSDHPRSLASSPFLHLQS